LAFSQIIELPSYNVISNSTTISGLSSGGYMAVQFQVAYSSMIVGASSIAGGPYGCSDLNINRALFACMTMPQQIDVNKLVTLAKRYESDKRIDSLSNLKSHKTHVFHGTSDSTVRIGCSEKLIQFYKQLGVEPLANLRTPAQHAMITDDYGNACSFGGSPWINNCGISLAGDIFKYFYGDMKAPVTPIPENFMSFNQRAFTSSLGSRGLIYVPTKCKSKEPCRLHVVFHGCEQSYDQMQDRYAKNSGYNKWAESNDIIVLYPQVTTSAWNPMNPKACWDWWGYTGGDAYTRNGPQMVAIKKMIEKLRGQ
jgi:poly(3-hydroxybutyrate) depolymerase